MPEVVTIGDCTLYRGDCLEVLPTLGRGSVDAVVTDPMYGVNFEYHSVIDTPDVVRLVMVPAIRACSNIAQRMAVTSGTRCAFMYPPPDEMGCIYFPAGAGFSRWGFTCFQPILFYGKDPDPPNHKRPNSATCTEMAEKNGHPCPKPIGLMTWLVDRTSRIGETILDPFMGSGTTGVACVRTGRKFIGIEIEPRYFDIACRRIEDEYAKRALFEPVPQREVQTTIFAEQPA